MKRKWLTLWAVFVLALVTIEVWVVIAYDPLVNFYVVVVAIAAIGILSIIGAVFVGIFIATRILSAAEFTPFEKEMLAMREDVKRLTAKVEELGSRADDPGEKR